MGVSVSSQIYIVTLLIFSVAAPSISIRENTCAATLNPEREALTLQYIRDRYDATATSTKITPTMIVIHYTASSTLRSACETFKPVRLSGRADISGASSLNVAAHYVIDRDGTIHRVLPDTMMGRHTIGLNRHAIGIENVAKDETELTPAQLDANVKLIQHLSTDFDIRYVIGHMEYGAFRKSSLWEDRDPNYFTVKSDPGHTFMKNLRERLGARGLSFKSSP